MPLKAVFFGKKRIIMFEAFSCRIGSDLSEAKYLYAFCANLEVSLCFM